MDSPELHWVRAVTLSHGHDEFIHVKAPSLRGSEPLKRIYTKPKLGKGGKNLKSLRSRRHCADIVAEQAVALAMELGSQRGFARALSPDEDHCSPGRLHRASMKRKQASLVEQSAHGRAQQKQANFFERDIRKRLDEDSASFLDPVLSHAGHRQTEDTRLNFIVAIFQGFQGVLCRRQQTDRHIRISRLQGKGRKLWAIQLCVDTKAIRPVCVKGHLRPQETQQSRGLLPCTDSDGWYRRSSRTFKCPVSK